MTRRATRRRARGTRRARSRNAGFAIVSAVFLVVVLALLAGLLVNLSNANQLGQVRDLLGTRALFAARAGVDWGAYQALQAGSCAAAATLPALAGSATGFTVSVACTQSGPFDEAGNSVSVYRIVATASQGTPGSVNFAERQVVAVVSAP